MLSFFAVLLRLAYGTRNIILDWRYYALLLLSLFGTLVAYLGFRQLAGVPVNEMVDYSQILTVLSLLAAGIITGYFTFTYEQSAADERFLPTALSTCFALLFYLVFGAISFYMGKSKQIHSTEGANTVGPIIMWVLLLANSFHDFWDYRKGPPQGLTRPLDKPSEPTRISMPFTGKRFGSVESADSQILALSNRRFGKHLRGDQKAGLRI